MDEKVLRDYLQRYLDWHEAHADFKAAFKDFPVKERGKRPPGLPHSAWELLEHMRIATWDILEFSRDAKHVSPDWPSGYWPKNPAPPNAAAWDKSVKALEQDLEEMGKLVTNPKTDLLAPHSPRIGPDDSARSSADRRPQCLPPGTVRAGAPAAGLLAGKLSAASRRSAPVRIYMME